MKMSIRPLRLSKDTLCPLGDENLLVVQGGMPTPGFTTECPDPTMAATCATCVTCIATCTVGETATTTSMNRPTTTN